MTQAAIAILLARPDDARGRPGNYIGAGDTKKTGNKHKMLFRPRSNAKSLKLSYLKCVLIVRRVTEFLKGASGIDPGDRRNLLFYVAYHSVCGIVGTATPSVEDIIAITSPSITNERLETAYEICFRIYRRLTEKEDNPDIVAKGSEFLIELKKLIPETEKASPTTIPLTPRREKIRDVLQEAEFAW